MKRSAINKIELICPYFARNDRVKIWILRNGKKSR
jgi:hypothetical protein